MARKKVPLAWRNLTFDRRRLMVSMAGVMFASILMFMELGYKNALFDSSYALLSQLDGDIFLFSSMRDRLGNPQVFPRRRLFQALAHPEVEATYPVYLHMAGQWRNPQNGKRTGIRVLGINPGDPVFVQPDLNAQLPQLSENGTVLMDAKSRRKFGQVQVGTQTELQGRSVRVVGLFYLGPDFNSEGNLVTSDQNFLRFFPETQAEGSHLTSVSLGLLKLKKGADATRVRDELLSLLSDDLTALTKPQMIAFEKHFWDVMSPIGPIFNMGAAIGFVVGMVICYQILFTDLSDQLPQFATLKAIGYDNSYLMKVVVSHALFLSLVSFLPAVVCSFILYEVLARFTGLPMNMTLALVLLIFVLTVVMCVAAGRIAVRKVLSADPAELFR